MPLKKIGRAIKKTVRKVVPKEVAGIMTAAAPFVAPTSLPLAAALSIGGQLRMGRGRINPITTALSLAPGLLFDPLELGQLHIFQEDLLELDKMREHLI